MRTGTRTRVATWIAAIMIGGIFAAMRPMPGTAAEKLRTFIRPAARFMVATEGNEARFRVREELAGMDFPNDAVGVTKAVTGAIAFDDKGKVIREDSKFVVDLKTLTSDKARRDNFVRERTLETDKYPTATFVPFELRGVPAKLPTTGNLSFQVAGQLTIHGMTRFTVWDVTAEAGASSYSGTAKTAFVFADFGMDQPAVPVVLSVNDTIRLEYDFKLVKAE